VWQSLSIDPEVKRLNVRVMQSSNVLQAWLHMLTGLRRFSSSISTPDYVSGNIGKCLGPTMSKGPTKDSGIIF